jgi:hypothetical protein
MEEADQTLPNRANILVAWVLQTVVDRQEPNRAAFALSALFTGAALLELNLWKKTVVAEAALSLEHLVSVVTKSKGFADIWSHVNAKEAQEHEGLELQVCFWARNNIPWFKFTQSARDLSAPDTLSSSFIRFQVPDKVHFVCHKFPANGVLLTFVSFSLPDA